MNLLVSQLHTRFQVHSFVSKIKFHMLCFFPTQFEAYFLQCLPPTFTLSLTSSLVSSTKTMLSIYNMLSKTLPQMCQVGLSNNKANKYGLNADHQCKPIVIGNSGFNPPKVLTFVIAVSFMSLVISIYATLTLFFSSTLYRISRTNLSYVFSKSTKTICKSCFFYRYLSINLLKR